MERGNVSAPGIRLGPGAEFDLIRRMSARGGALADGVRTGSGDDAAVLDGGWVVSTDISVENVHFRRAWISAEEAGFRAVSAAISDIAAMAARPVGVLLSFAIPEGETSYAEGVAAGAHEAAAAVGASVIGGDVSRSPAGFVIDVTVVGQSDRPVLRDGAEVGDELWVTGELGASAAAVRRWDEGREPEASLRSAFVRPTPRVREALDLGGSGVCSALIDVSDGLAGDAGHLAAASGVRIVIAPSAVPTAEAALAALGPDDALDAALHGGEDYELLFTARTGAVDAPGLSERLGIPVTRVGRVEEGAGVWVEQEDGPPRPLERGGFDHLGDAAREDEGEATP